MFYGVNFIRFSFFGGAGHRVCIIYLVHICFMVEYVLFISFLFSLSENGLHSPLCMCDAVGMSGN